MIVTVNPPEIRRRSKRRWHRKTIFMRKIIIGGDGTDEPPRRTFVLIGRLWARRSISLNRWVFAEHRPSKKD